jgi:hypothetical protein
VVPIGPLYGQGLEPLISKDFGARRWGASNHAFEGRLEQAHSMVFLASSVFHLNTVRGARPRSPVCRT